MIPRIVAHGKDVFIIGEVASSKGTYVGARRWIKKTAKFSGQFYVRGYLHTQGTEVPVGHPAHAALAEILAQRARTAAYEQILTGPRASLETK